MKTLLFLSLFFPILAFSQALSIKDNDEGVFYEINGDISSKIPENSLGVGLYVIHESYHVWYVERTGEDSFVLLQDLGELQFNIAKPYVEATFFGDTLEFGSEMPYRSTLIIFKYIWKDGLLTESGTRVEDFSEDMKLHADSLLAIGKIRDAVIAYESVMYPMSYLNEDWVGKDLILTGDSIAKASLEKGNVRRAYTAYKDAFLYYDCTKWLSVDSKEEVSTLISHSYGTWTLDSMAMYLSNYSLLMTANGYNKEGKELSRRVKEFYGEDLFLPTYNISTKDFVFPNPSWYRFDGPDTSDYLLYLYAEDTELYGSGYRVSDSAFVHLTGYWGNDGTLNWKFQDPDGIRKHWASFQTEDNGATYQGSYNTSRGNDRHVPYQATMKIDSDHEMRCPVIIKSTTHYCEIPVVMTGNDEIDRVLSYDLNLESITETALADFESRWHLEDEFERKRGLSMISSWEVTKNDNCILSIVANLEHMGAYLSTWSRYYTYSTATGIELTVGDVFIAEQRSTLAKKVNERLQVQVQKEIEEWEMDAPEIQDLLGVVEFSEHHLDQFYFDGKHVVFYYEFGLPHIYKAMEPLGRIVFSEAELEGFLKLDL